MLRSKSAVTVAESYTLTGSNQKAFAISGTKAIDLTGNGIANVVVGNDGANKIAGKAGNDTLTGKSGKDQFVFDTTLSKNLKMTEKDFFII
jgi:Ca2+-binding RTX toxin-like protein